MACWLLFCLFLACPATTHCCSDAKVFQLLPILCSKHKLTSLAQPVQLGLGVFKDWLGSLHLWKSGKHSAKYLLNTPCRALSPKNSVLSHGPFRMAWQFRFVLPFTFPHLDYLNVPSKVGCILICIFQKFGHRFTVQRIRFLWLVSIRATVEVTTMKLIRCSSFYTPPIDE